ncbi:MAG: ubiquinone/menaquinone biosynthesis methyltransferase [Armatimonadetes bacterium]|nr:ubiquinone/menaquinone biosynthesis methyltransferase [Armatimonadota bacterium]MDW8028982.1 ubiquinone/menaquinone biosynthesis methyltransferase [Armatimonadota bacterium]
MESLLKRKREAIRQMFSAIAPKYDLLNRLLSGFQDVRWRKFAVDWLSPSTRLIVDIGTGTGDFAFAAIKRCREAKVIGIDISEPMLVLAKSKANSKRVSDRYKLICADGLNLPLADGVADAVLSAFVVRNFEDLSEGIREMFRILKPEGVALILEFCQPPVEWWWTPIGLFVRYVVPMVGALLSNPVAYAYLTASIQTFTPSEAIANIMFDVGFKKVASLPLTFSVATLFRAVK